LSDWRLPIIYQLDRRAERARGQGISSAGISPKSRKTTSSSVLSFVRVEFWAQDLYIGDATPPECPKHIAHKNVFDDTLA
jgi:hypothetical protein